MSAWLHIIGVTEQGLAGLMPAQRALVDAAETIITSVRFADELADAQNVIIWSPGFKQMLAQVLSHKGQPTVVLATGDPNWFGVGASLAKQLSPDEFVMHPAPSSFQLAAARLRWAVPQVACITLHGRAVETLHPHVVPHNRILALTSDATTFVRVAQILTARGYGGSRLHVLENLGGADERILTFPADEASRQTIGEFYVLGIECVADDAAQLLPSIPGLPDDAFLNDGQLTKRDVRATTLAKLAPYPGALLWDVGAGCGSVAIEWMRAAPRARAIAFEQNENRCELITQNSAALGTPNLEVAVGDALPNLGDAETPDAIFLGGDVANDELFERCYKALKPGGRLVANAVTVASEQSLFQRQAKHGGELTRIEISTLSPVGDEQVMRPRMAVTQWVVIK